AQQIVAIFVTDRDAVAAIVFQNVLLKQAVPDTPAEKQAVLTIVAGGAIPNDRALRTTAREQAPPRVLFAGAGLGPDIVGLLKADAVGVVIPHETILDHRAETAIKENPRAAATIESDILFLVAVDG